MRWNYGVETDFVTCTVGFHKSLRGPSVCSKITLITGHVGATRVCPPTCKMGTFFNIHLALTMPISTEMRSKIFALIQRAIILAA